MQKFLQVIYSKILQIKRQKIQTSMIIVYCYGGGLALLTLLMITSWAVSWYHSGSPDVNALIDIFKNYTATQVVAAATFVSVFCVDTDGDGRPDAAQKQAEKNKPTPPPAIPIRLENKK